MTGDELRDQFLAYFAGKSHRRMPSASLIPAGDPTLLLTSAGMVPFKPYFTGDAEPPNRRLTSCQKCFRTTDIDSVGDTKHLTFFEMLGNFSIGDYFKPEAISWAWEFVTQHLGLPADRLWVTVYLDDDEAFRYWRDQIGVPEERIYRYGKSDNWWGPAGSEGPCGPCSEIHYDYGSEHGCAPLAGPHEASAYEERDVGCHPNCDREGCGRFVELWNLVFMQFYCHLDGSLTDLPRPNIDTGMGLERALAIVQGKSTVYGTDLFSHLVARVSGLCGRAYGTDDDTDYAIRVVAEHARGLTFLVGDGAVPGNEGRGYVLRRMARRAIRFGRQLGLRGAFLNEMAREVIEQMGNAYPELARNREFILKTIELEESRFRQTLNTVMPLLEEGLIPLHQELIQSINDQLLALITEAGGDTDAVWGLRGLQAIDQRIDSSGILEALAATYRERIRPVWLVDSVIAELRGALHEGGIKGLMGKATVLTAPEVFVLHDTYGFPPELAQEIAAEHSLGVDLEGFERIGIDVPREYLGIDLEGFEREMEAQRERARSQERFDADRDHVRAYEALGVGSTRFVGYETMIQPTVVVALVVENRAVDAAREGQKVEVVLRETPFYPEGGGQVGDAGMILGDHGRIEVRDTQRPAGDLIVHSGVVVQGAVEAGEQVEAQVDREHRLSSARNHTATHLLHAALRAVLGVHVRQAGSLVAPDRLRFDFTATAPTSRDELEAVERLVNRKIRENLRVRKRETSYQSAVDKGALAFFGERYADQVRVVEMANGAPFSLEVCGGTHLERTGEVGFCVIVSESSIGSGMRRIEALTGPGAEEFVRRRLNMQDRLAHMLDTSAADLEERVQHLEQELDQSRKRGDALERRLARSSAQALLERVQEADGTRVIAGAVEASSMDALRDTADWLKDKLGSGVVVLGAVLEGRPSLVAMATPDLVSRGYSAGDIVREVAKVVGGGGGGRPHMAQAGGRNPEKLDEALARVPGIVASQAPRS